jgi:ribosomal protein S1
VHISEITYGHVNNIDRFGNVGDPLEVKVIGLENGKISLSCKQMKPDPWSIIPKEYKIGDLIEGQVIRFVPYGVFVKVYDDINGLIHLSELGIDRGANLNDVVKLGQMIKAQVILLDPRARKIGLSIKAMNKAAEKKAEAEKKTDTK